MVRELGAQGLVPPSVIKDVLLPMALSSFQDQSGHLAAPTTPLLTQAGSWDYFQPEHTVLGSVP